MIKKKTIFTVIIFAIMTVGIVAGVILLRSNQDIREKAAPLTNLSFNPATTTVIKGQTFNSSVKVDTGTNSVTGVDIELTYNPAIIQLTSITPTSALANFTSSSTGQVIRNEINNTTGNARFIAYTNDKTLGMIGSQDILTISGTVNSGATAGDYQISFGNLTVIAALNEGQNALLNKTPLTLVVTLPTASPSPTPTVSPTATPTLSPSPTPVVTESPTVTTSPTATPVVFRDWDVDQNRIVNIIDIGLVADDYGSLNPVTPRANVDKKDGINIVDIGIVVDHLDETY